jgi:serine/threonine protein kinase
MAASQSIDREGFLANLRESGLFAAQELAELAARLPKTNRGRVVARALVDQGMLTRFQAERLLAGRTGGFVLGQYRILDELGRGGMGRVFKAVHRTMNRTVALKVLAPQLVETAKAQALFLREMRAVARLMHPNIVTAYDANQVGNRYYLVMEYVDGPSLHRLVHDQGPLPPGLACEMIRQVASGLQYAHEMGMVHRDIKPANLLVLPPGGEARRKALAVKILDFGLARLHGASEDELGGEGTIVARPDMILGTPDFLSPEQARDVHLADIRSDLYSLGCTFYFLLSGKVPFPGGSNLEKIIRHSTQEPMPLTQFRPDLPPRVVALAARLMAKDPAARYQTPAELEKALEGDATQPPLSWVATRPQSAEDLPGRLDSSEVLPTPRPVADAELDLSFPLNDDLSALASTWPPDLTSTPVSDTSLARVRARRAWTADELRRARLALGVTSALLVILLGVAFVVWLAS